MSLPKTIWWCSRHGSGQDYWEHIVPTCGAYKAGWSDPCVWTTLPVAGPDDLVIRREDDGSWPDWVLVGLGWELDDSHDLSAVMNGVWRERPRAAAKGGEK